MQLQLKGLLKGRQTNPKRKTGSESINRRWSGDQQTENTGHNRTEKPRNYMKSRNQENKHRTKALYGPGSKTLKLNTSLRNTETQGY